MLVPTRQPREGPTGRGLSPPPQWGQTPLSAAARQYAQ
ncbi:MAG: hypothetical protein JWN88_1038, partial [Frankiales bacterium]|nr:hypothetical protein [Frankiales bacterium]